MNYGTVQQITEVSSKSRFVLKLDIQANWNNRIDAMCQYFFQFRSVFKERLCEFFR